MSAPQLLDLTPASVLRFLKTILSSVDLGSEGPGADTGFSVGGGANPPGGANIQICWIFPRTA